MGCDGTLRARVGLAPCVIPLDRSLGILETGMDFLRGRRGTILDDGAMHTSGASPTVTAAAASFSGSLFACLYLHLFAHLPCTYNLETHCLCHIPVIRPSASPLPPGAASLPGPSYLLYALASTTHDPHTLTQLRYVTRHPSIPPCVPAVRRLLTRSLCIVIAGCSPFRTDNNKSPFCHFTSRRVHSACIARHPLCQAMSVLVPTMR